jgi:serine/threonine protein phosphatase PrpC
MSPITAIGRSHPGSARVVNEDAFLAEADLRLLTVADGMGGHKGGEVASRLAVETVGDFIRASATDSGITWPYGLEPSLSFEANQLLNAIQLAHHRILSEAMARPELAGMGSTIVAALVTGGRAVYTNVGDSRLYLLRGGTLRQLTEDHSWAASMRQAGVDAAVINTHPMRHFLTRALGSEETLDLQVRDEALERGDLLLLCTDGLSGPVGDEEMARIAGEPSAGLDEIAVRLIDAANRAGGPDNITVVLARYGAEA